MTMFLLVTSSKSFVDLVSFYINQMPPDAKGRIGESQRIFQEDCQTCSFSVMVNSIDRRKASYEEY